MRLQEGTDGLEPSRRTACVRQHRTSLPGGGKHSPSDLACSQARTCGWGDRVKRRACVVAAAATLAAPWPVTARGQRARRVGVLYPSVDPGKPPPASAAAWRKVESVLGETVRVERRYAARRLERLPQLADDLLRKGDVEVLWAFGHAAAVAAVQATRTVPIVFSFAFMPVESGLVGSLAKPTGNVTGFAIADGPEEPLKVFDFVRATAPSARRWGSLTGDPNLATVSGSRPAASPSPGCDRRRRRRVDEGSGSTSGRGHRLRWRFGL